MDVNVDMSIYITKLAEAAPFILDLNLQLTKVGVDLSFKIALRDKLRVRKVLVFYFLFHFYFAL